jgi:glycine cleavage system H protein
MSTPQDLKYSKEHEWVRVEGDVGTVGITQYAVSSLGDVVFVELPEVGDEFDQDGVFGSVESTKAVSDLFCPVAGEIVEINEALEDAPESVNGDCYGEGWIMKIKITDPSQLDGLMDAAAYDALTAES